jgi:hypothetical protein
VDRRGASDAALVLDERALVERSEPFGTPAAELRPQNDGAAPEQPLRSGAVESRRTSGSRCANSIVVRSYIVAVGEMSSSASLRTVAG